MKSKPKKRINVERQTDLPARKLSKTNLSKLTSVAETFQSINIDNRKHALTLKQRSNRNLLPTKHFKKRTHARKYRYSRISKNRLIKLRKTKSHSKQVRMRISKERHLNVNSSWLVRRLRSLKTSRINTSVVMIYFLKKKKRKNWRRTMKIE